MSYGYKPGKKGERARPTINCGPIKTKQSFGAQSDIRNILDRYRKTGIVDYVNKATPVFMDVASMGNLHDMLGKVKKAEAAFEGLSPIVRTRFNNNSTELLEFLADKENKDEAVKLGLIPAPKEPVVKPPAPKAKEVEKAKPSEKGSK